MQIGRCTVWRLSFSAVDYIYTISLCREGYIGPSTIPGSWEWAGTFFVLLNTFVFFFGSLALVLQKSLTRNKELTRFTLKAFDFKAFFANFHLCTRYIQRFQNCTKTVSFLQDFRQKSRLKIALQVSKIAFSLIVMP